MSQSAAGLLTPPTLFITEGAAYRAACLLLRQQRGKGRIKVFPRCQRNPDTRQVERGYVATVRKSGRIFHA